MSRHELTANEKLEKVQLLLKKHWDRNNQDIKKIVALDETTHVLNRPARFILKEYVDRVGVLAKDSNNPKAIKEMAALLDSLEYLTKVLKKLSKKRISKL